MIVWMNCRTICVHTWPTLCTGKEMRNVVPSREKLGPVSCMHPLANVPTMRIHHPAGSVEVWYGVTEVRVGSVAPTPVGVGVRVGVGVGFFFGVAVGVGDGVAPTSEVGVRVGVASGAATCFGQKYQMPPRTMMPATTQIVVVFIVPTV